VAESLKLRFVIELSVRPHVGFGVGRGRRALMVSMIDMR